MNKCKFTGKLKQMKKKGLIKLCLEKENLLITYRVRTEGFVEKLRNTQEALLALQELEVLNVGIQKGLELKLDDYEHKLLKAGSVINQLYVEIDDLKNPLSTTDILETELQKQIKIRSGNLCIQEFIETNDVLQRTKLLESKKT